ncbi:carbohydrate ABC transporter permease [Alkalihalobacillus sp. 1P02AB]|uniref:carbohydrate ABC transporter permease n=1 Tax=Alkalihalobacillus sp. 1P02AB TaxID=3132260 RepID=UPI0039A5D244
MSSSTTKHKGTSKRKREETYWAWFFIGPTLIGLLIFYTLPTIVALGLGFTSWDGLSTPIFNGLENFTRLFQDEKFIRSIWNTVLYTFVTVPVSISIATVIAVLLNQKIKGVSFYRTIYFLPVITMPVAVAMLWRWLYNTDYGIINYILKLVNLPGVSWLQDERTVLLSIMLVAIWSGVGFNIVLLMAGLQGIPQTYYEAADLDGASSIRKFFTITLPLLTPSIFFASVIGIINSFQVFDYIFVMSPRSGSVLDATRTMVYSIYEVGFTNFELGYASAQSLILFIFILLVTIIQMKMQKKWVHYN